MDRARHTDRTLAGALRDDRGYALALTVGIMLIMTVMGMALLANADNALNNAMRVEREGTAFQVAEAGLEAALTDMQYNTYVPAHFPLTGNLHGGSYSVTVEDLGTTEYKVVSVGTTPSGHKSTVVEKFFYLNMWAMNVASGSQQSLVSGSSGLHGNTSVYGPLYIRGSVEFPSNSSIGKGPLFVRDGDISITGSGRVGENATPIDVYITGAHPVAGANGWFVKKVSGSVPVITLPVMSDSDLAARQDKAAAESVDNIQGTPSKSGSANHEATYGDGNTYSTMTPPNDGTWTRQKAPGAGTNYKVIEGDLNIAPGTSWGSWYGDGHTTTSGEHDDFAYDGNGTLYVEGTVFVNGDLHISGDTAYVGNGTFVVNGNVTIDGKFLPVGGNLMASHALGIAAMGDINLNCTGGNFPDPDDSTPADISGAFFCNGTFNLNDHLVFRGTAIAGGISFNVNNAHLMTNPLLPTFLPDSLPGNSFSIMASSSWGRR